MCDDSFRKVHYPLLLNQVLIPDESNLKQVIDRLSTTFTQLQNNDLSVTAKSHPSHFSDMWTYNPIREENTQLKQKLQMLKEIKAAGSTTQMHIETRSSKAKKDFEAIKDTTQKFIHCLDQRLSQCGDELSEVESTYGETSK